MAIGPESRHIPALEMDPASKLSVASCGHNTSTYSYQKLMPVESRFTKKPKNIQVVREHSRKLKDGLRGYDFISRTDQDDYFDTVIVPIPNNDVNQATRREGSIHRRWDRSQLAVFSKMGLSTWWSSAFMKFWKRSYAVDDPTSNELSKWSWKKL